MLTNLGLDYPIKVLNPNSKEVGLSRSEGQSYTVLGSHRKFHSMGANYLLTPFFIKNRWVQIDLSQNRWVQLHPLTQPNETPAFINPGISFRKC